VVVVSDRRVAGLYGRSFLTRLSRDGVRAHLLAFPDGERFKTRETKARLEDRLAAARVGRDAVVVAFGGGVTADLAGFLAATWHRGIPVVQVPTTLLAMVDAALGGKTGLDLPAGKNLIGAFHQPVSLFADVDVLRTLPDREFRCGLAEAVKTGVALDAGLFRWIEASADRLLGREPSAVEALVARCLRLKGNVVARDERDAGARAALNFGHTVAHAVEAASAWRIRHGEAVAIGMVVEARIAQRLTGFPAAATSRLEALLHRVGLKTRVPRAFDLAAFARHARRDKKVRDGRIRCALPLRIGRLGGGGDPTVPVDLSRDLLPAMRLH